MKFTALCLFVILGAAVGKPVDTEQPAKAKEPVPLIVSDYSSVVKEDSSSTVAAVVPAEKSSEEVAPAAPVTDAPAPATDAPASDEEDLVKEFNEEVKQEEKLLTPEASNVDEVRKELEEEVAVTTEAVVDAKNGKSVVSDEVKTEEEEEVAETTTEPAAASDSVARVVREAEEIATSTDEPKSEEATSTDEPKEARDNYDAPEVTTTRAE